MHPLNQIIAGMHVNPGVPAFIDPDGAETSYPAFGEHIRRLAGGLRRHLGEGSGTIGILALNSRPYLELMLAANWAGRAAVPLNIRWAARELAFALKDADIKLLLVDDFTLPLVAALRDLGAPLPQLFYRGDKGCPPDMLPYEELLAAAPAEPASVDVDSMAAIVYTGGTTGQSKGVVHTQSSLMASALNWLCMGGTPPQSRCLLALPLFHVGAIGIALAQMLQRATLVMIPAFRPELVRQAVMEYGADVLAVVPTMIGMILDAPEFEARDYRGLRAIAYGASPMPTSLLGRIMTSLPHVALAQAYGMTEVGLAVVLTDRRHRESEANLAAAGQPGPLYDVRIVDANGQEVPRGVLGEVAFAGPGVMVRYLNQPELTAEVLRNGYLHSGDAGIMDADGVITLLDRKKDMIVTGAENVYSVEVENAVSSHPAVQQCAVIGVPDDVLGERVHAVIVLHPGQTLTHEELRQHCAPLLAGYKHPRSLEIKSFLPLSPMGKVLKTELRATHWAGRERRLN